MHRTDRALPQESTAVVAPPVVPPPIVSPLSAEQAPPVAEQAPPEIATSSCFPGRCLRDLMIGGSCLLLGLLINPFAVLQGGQRSRQPANASDFTADRPAEVAFRPEQISVHAQSPATIVDLAVEIPAADQPQSLNAKSSPAVAKLDAAELDDDEVDFQVRYVPATSFAEQAAVTAAPPNGSDLLDDIPNTLPAEKASSVTLASTTKPPADQQVGIEPTAIAPSASEAAKPNEPDTCRLAETELSPPAPPCVDGTCQLTTTPTTTESLGTQLRWTDTPADAYRLAKEQHKLVFLIHVSGNFEIPGFT